MLATLKLRPLPLIVMAALLACCLAGLFLAGCAEQAVPGGKRYIAFETTNPETKITTKIIARGNDDSDLRGLKVKGPNGWEVELASWQGNGSNLGDKQMQWSMLESNNRRAVWGDLIGMIRELAPMLGGAAGVSLPATGTTTAVTPTVTDLAPLKKAVLDKIAACPFLAQNTVQRDALIRQVEAAPPSKAAYEVLSMAVDAFNIQVPK